MFALKSGAFALTMALLSTCAYAQERNKGIEVSGDVKQPGVDAVIELKARARSGDSGFKTVCEGACDKSGAAQLPIGTDVAVCFKVTADGYVTLWSVDSKGGFALIYPNKFSHPAKTRAAQVKANSSVCIGETETFRLSIRPPNGPSKVYLNWTRTEDEAFGPDDYPVIGGKDARASHPPYAEATLQYNIVSGN